MTIYCHQLARVNEIQNKDYSRYWFCTLKLCQITKGLRDSDIYIYLHGSSCRHDGFFYFFYLTSQCIYYTPCPKPYIPNFERFVLNCKVVFISKDYSTWRVWTWLCTHEHVMMFTLYPEWLAVRYVYIVVWNRWIIPCKNLFRSYDIFMRKFVRYQSCISCQEWMHMSTRMLTPLPSTLLLLYCTISTINCHYINLMPLLVGSLSLVPFIRYLNRHDLYWGCICFLPRRISVFPAVPSSAASFFHNVNKTEKVAPWPRPGDANQVWRTNQNYSGMVDPSCWLMKVFYWERCWLRNLGRISTL